MPAAYLGSAIETQALRVRYLEGRKLYPWMEGLHGAHNLPDCLLWAVGWVETRLVNERGDGGHGHGIFQLDDRSHPIPKGFDDRPFMQADTAAGMLRQLLLEFQLDIEYAVAAYNAGPAAIEPAFYGHRDPNPATTHGEYAAHVLWALDLVHGWHGQLVVQEARQSRRQALG